MLQHRELPVLITVDVCDGAYEPGERKPRFKSVMDALPEISAVLTDAVMQAGVNNCPATWFVRADSQVKEQLGDTAALVRGYSSFWQEIRQQGGELGWHPHLYRRENRLWKPIRDTKRLAAEAEKIWLEITSSGWRPECSRMGESVGSSELMVFLDSAGIRCDSSAVPGRSRDDGVRWFDWEGTPDIPYYPAKRDYRRPPVTLGAGDRVEGEEPVRTLEVPFTMAPIRAPYDKQLTGSRQPRRYIDLSYDTLLLKAGLEGQYRSWRYLVLVVHPLQAVGREVPEGGLVKGGISVVRDNLKLILHGILVSGRVPRFMTLSEFRALWLGEKTEKTAAVPAQTGSRGRQKKETLRGEPRPTAARKAGTKTPLPDLTGKVRTGREAGKTTRTPASRVKGESRSRRGGRGKPRG